MQQLNTVASSNDSFALNVGESSYLYCILLKNMPESLKEACPEIVV
jgi:hypothetical protein